LYEPASELIAGALSAISETAKKAGTFSNPVASWHKQAIEGAVDPNWSPMAQAQAESYLADAMSSDIELISVKCNRTVCEIQAASTSAQNSEKAANEWQAGISAMSAESWWTGFGFATPNSAIWSSSDGRAILVSYLTRAE
jgi:hypothetical protein